MQKFSLIYLTLCCMLLNTGIAQTTTDTLKGQTLSNEPTSTPTEEFRETLLGTYLDFDTAKTFGDMASASNWLKLIAGKWSDQWAAQYYASFMLTILSYAEKDESKRDSYLDEAESFLTKAKDLYKKNNDEMYVMAAMIANARLAVKPGSRYKTYGEIFNSNLDSAKNINPNNPRIYYLQGTGVFYTPKLFGGGAKNAFPYFEKAGYLYQNEKGDDIFKPYWGKKKNEEMLNKCKEESD